MSSGLRVVLFVGILCLLVGFSTPVLADDIQHEHPEEADEDRDLESVERWLSNQVGEIHVDCAGGIEIGAFDACEDLDSDEYSELLDRYITVEDDRQGETETAERFNETRSQQREYAALREEFEATFEEYEAARSVGDDAEARAHARELQRLAERIEELGGELEVNFAVLDESVETDFERSSRIINESTSEVRTVRIAVEAESFEETAITATTSETASFDDPGTLSGRVTAENGTGIGEGEVVVSDGHQTFTTTTVENGSYELSYRPTVSPIGATNLTIQYQPAAGDPYLRSETTGTVSVRSTPSELRIENSTTRASFNEELIVTGTVRAADRGVSDVEVSMRVDGDDLGTTTTDANGDFRIVTHVPVTLEATTQPILLQASEPERALEPSRETVDVTIEETETELRARAIGGENGVNITGQLTADTESSVGSRPITVEVGSESYTVQTDESGHYNLSVTSAAEPPTITVTYDESGTNLARSHTEATVEYERGLIATTVGMLQSIGTSVATVIQRSPIVSVLISLGVVGAFVMALRRGWRWYVTGPTGDDELSESKISEEDISTESIGESPVSAQSLLETAREKLNSDPKTAVYASYTAVRSGFDINADQTHWELYNQHDTEATENPENDLYTLIQTFERAAFAAEEIEVAQATAALEAAEHCLRTRDADHSTD